MGELFSSEPVFTEEGLKKYSANELREIINNKGKKLNDYKEKCTKKINEQSKELTIADRIYIEKTSYNFNGGTRKNKSKTKTKVIPKSNKKTKKKTKKKTVLKRTKK